MDGASYVSTIQNRRQLRGAARRGYEVGEPSRITGHRAASLRTLAARSQKLILHTSSLCYQSTTCVIWTVRQIPNVSNTASAMVIGSMSGVVAWSASVPIPCCTAETIQPGMVLTK